MSVARKDPAGSDASSDDGALHPHGSFFGRRKVHRLREYMDSLYVAKLQGLAK